MYWQKARRSKGPAQYLTEAEFKQLYDQTCEVARIVGALRAAVARGINQQ